MKKKYKNNNANAKDQNLSEPAASYITKNKLQFFNSFEEASQSEAKYIISQSPIERLRQTIELILRAYNVTRQNLRERKSSNRITIMRTK